MSTQKTPSKTIQKVNGQWNLTLDVVPDAIELGRLLHKTIQEWAAAKGKESLHIRVILGAMGYVGQIHEERGHVLADDFLLANKLIRDLGLGERVNEPYAEYIASLEGRAEGEVATEQQEQEAAPMPAPAVSDVANSEVAA